MYFIFFVNNFKISKLVQPNESLEKPYNANDRSYYIEMLIVVDNDVYNHFDKNVDRIHKYFKDVINIVNSVSKRTLCRY